MAKKKSSSKILYIALGIVLIVFLWDNFTSEESIINLSKKSKDILGKSKDILGKSKDILGINENTDIKFNLVNFEKEKKEIHKFKNWVSANPPRQNPFYRPIKGKVRKVYKKPSLAAKITQIIDGNPPYAEIAGQYLTIGEKYKGWEITSITERGVTFKKGANRITIGLSR